LGLTGCGQSTFQSPPDCSGEFMVAFARQTSADTADVYLYDFDAVGFRLLANLNSTTQADLNPTITRDVRFIAFERWLTPGNADIEVYDRCQAAMVPEPGLDTQASERDPAFSGDGAKLAFVRDTLGRREVRLYNGAAFRLIALPGLAGAGSYIDADPAPNQDGSLIAFTSNRRGTNDVLVYDAKGDSLMNIPDLASPANDSDPSMTPDGRFIAFASDRAVAGDYDLYLYDLTNRAFVPLTGVNTPSSERHPSLNFDSSQMVFESTQSGTLGGSDLYLYQRGSGKVNHLAASSPMNDVEPWIVWQ
jgi:Tol biopolymer transport system component